MQDERTEGRNEGRKKIREGKQEVRKKRSEGRRGAAGRKEGRMERKKEGRGRMDGRRGWNGVGKEGTREGQREGWEGGRMDGKEGGKGRKEGREERRDGQICKQKGRKERRDDRMETGERGKGGGQTGRTEGRNISKLKPCRHNTRPMRMAPIELRRHQPLANQATTDKMRTPRKATLTEADIHEVRSQREHALAT